MAPAQTPSDMVKWLEQQTLQVLKEPAMQEKFLKAGFLVRPKGGADAWARVTKEMDTFKDIIEGVTDLDEGRREMKAAQAQARYEQMDGKDLERELKLLEKQMFEAAKNLEFEKAAGFRDRLYKLKEKLFGVALPTET